ncbi:SRPBCC family protein [Nocardia altamirensis]|uniref:SRPBCC family protein n=1 Tax=Nocardia altamirensis TaxID=472158 RepID=UPI00083FE403|nr:SRPBCC family protein [Nocardia altamirensis]
MTALEDTALHGAATVALPLDKAFAFFTESFGTWWPAVYHIGRTGMADAIMEPRAGGRWHERGTDGSECDWGRVVAWEPPNRLVVTWQINGYWQYDPDLERAGEIEVRFTETGPGQTSVTLEHRHLDRLVAGEALRDAIVEQGGGWSAVLVRFAKTAEAQA